MIHERSLAEADVYLYKVAGAGTCQIRTSLDTLYDGEIAAMGVSFSVQALTTSIDIQALEFANTPGSSPSTINIYARKGTSFSTTSSDWIALASTTSVVSPDGLGMITPRADMKQALTIAAGEAWTIYISSSASNIKLASTTSTAGTSYQVDDFLQLNVGESMAGGPEFSATRTGNRGFQGKLYYRVLKPCAELPTETELTFQFATGSGIDRVELNDAVTSGLNKLLTDEKDLKRWSQVHGLSIKSLDLKSKGSTEDCSEYGLKGGCDLYDSDIVFGHFKSLEARDLVLEFLLKLNFRNGLGDLGNGINVTYIGDEVLQQQYDVTITGVPSGTVLNPIQRDYLQHVTLDFLNEFSESVPNRVTIQQDIHRQRHLRSRESNSIRSQSSWSRSLEAGGTVKAEALVYGIGKEHEAFFKELEKAFVSNTKQYKEELQRQQYLPGEINDEKNFGAIFENISDVSVARSQASEPSSPVTTSSNEKLNSSQIQIIVFSIVIGLCFFWLVYRVMKDCVLVQDGWTVKKEKLSEKVEREKETAVTRPELSNMDKPRQRISTAIDVTSLPEIKVPVDESSVATKDATIRRGRKPTETSDHRREPTRGVRRVKSNDDDLLFSSISGNNLTNSQREPKRGVGRTRSSDDVDLVGAKGAPSASSIHDRSVASSRGVGRSKSNDLSHMVSGLHKENNDDSHSQRSRPPPATRGVKKSNTFNGAEEFLRGGSQGATKSGANQSSSNGKDTISVSSKKKPKSAKKKRGKADGESGDKSTKSSGEKAKKVKNKSASNLPRRVDMAGQRV